jgi:deoxyadenosine/deoxycytidine kinase
MAQGYFLAIAGNIGVGKTELTDRLAAELGWKVYYEPVIENPYLDSFYADMERWSFHLQIYFLAERFKAQVRIGQSGEAFIQDRTIYEDVEIFAKTLYEQGSMTKVDYENYKELFHCMTDYLRPPDLIIYLHASPDTLMERIQRRGRESEKTIGRDYLARLGAAYDDWIARLAKTREVRIIDTDSIPLQGPTPAFQDLVEELRRRYPPQVPLRLGEPAPEESAAASPPEPPRESAPEPAPEPAPERR